MKRFLILSGAAFGGAAIGGLTGVLLGSVGTSQIARKLTRKQGRACHSLTCIHFHQEGLPKQELGPFAHVPTEDRVQVPVLHTWGGGGHVTLEDRVSEIARQRWNRGL